MAPDVLNRCYCPFRFLQSPVNLTTMVREAQLILAVGAVLAAGVPAAHENRLVNGLVPRGEG